MWELSAKLIEKYGHAFVLRGDISIDLANRCMAGFFRGIDVIHVMWRLQDKLEAESNDFLRAASALRALFSHCFNPVYASDEAESSGVMPRAIFCVLRNLSDDMRLQPRLLCFPVSLHVCVESSLCHPLFN